MDRPPIAVRLAGVALLLGCALTAQSPTLYTFGVDQDNLRGAPDFSFLNHPLTAADHVFVRDGHFHTVGPDLRPGTGDDRRIRFFGMNLAFGANFPESQDAVRIARRLRRLGVNLVRLHHMDSQPDPAGNPSRANSILTDGPYPSFNDVSVRRLRDFLNALAAEGIYANLNLHVGYVFRPAVDQVPALPGLSMPTQSKPLHIFEPRMVQLQRQYARELLARLQLGGDPVLAMVEINNESSLVHEWQGAQLDPYLVGEYRLALGAQWNRWLQAKYASTSALAAAWGGGTGDGAEILPAKWTLEQGHGKTGSLSSTVTDGMPTAQVQPGQGSGWLFLKQTGFHLAMGVRYLWTFQARADLAAGQTVNAPVTVMRDVSPWDGFFSSSITLTNQWQTYAFAVTPTFPIDDSARVSIDVEFSPGNVYVRNMSLKQAGERGLGAGETLETATVALPGPSEGSTAARLGDYTSFLVATDRAYVNGMRDEVRSAAGPQVPVTGTQMGYGGLSVLDSQDGLDYQDNHFYIDHYNFPNTAWDGQDWRIRDSAAADNVWSSFLDMAWARPAGQPYTVSEFNQPWPNTHGAELDPSLAAFAAFQDWDGLIHFAYSHGRGWDDGVPNGFNINGDWTKYPGIGQAAWLFRSGAVAAAAQTLAVPVSAAERTRAAGAGQSISSWLVNRAGVPREIAFTRGVELAKDSPAELPPAAKSPLSTPFVADTGQLTFDRTAKLLLLDSPLAAGIFGAAGSRKITAGAIDLELAPSARGFAAVLVTPLDDRPLSSSARMLLSIPGYSLRSQPSADLPQTLGYYPGTTDWWTLVAPSAAKPSGDLNGGRRPTYMERVEAWVTLRTGAASIAVYPLDGAGTPLAALPASEVVAAPGGFRIHLNGAGQPASPWFSITAQRPRPRRPAR